MTHDARQRALFFLLGDHRLTPAETAEALSVASTVLDKGLARLFEAADTANAPLCAEAAHSLKGNLLNLGLPELAQTAQYATDAAHQGRLDDVRAAGQSLAQALASLLPRH